MLFLINYGPCLPNGSSRFLVMKCANQEISPGPFRTRKRMDGESLLREYWNQPALLQTHWYTNCNAPLANEEMMLDAASLILAQEVSKEHMLKCYLDLLSVSCPYEGIRMQVLRYWHWQARAAVRGSHDQLKKQRHLDGSLVRALLQVETPTSCELLQTLFSHSPALMMVLYECVDCADFFIAHCPALASLPPKLDTPALSLRMTKVLLGRYPESTELRAREKQEESFLAKNKRKT